MFCFDHFQIWRITIRQIKLKQQTESEAFQAHA